MSGNKSVTATFTLVLHTLTVDTSGQGNVTLDPAGGVYGYGTTVTLTPAPNVGYVFGSWGGVNGGEVVESGGVHTIVMNGDKAVTANFTPVQHTLTADTDGHGSVTLDPAGGVYGYGTTVTLTPVPNSGYVFGSWSGANAGDVVDASGIYTIVMNGDKAVTATFTEIAVPDVLGDIDGDDDVTSTEALIILSCDAGVDTTQFCPMNCGDVNGDGAINSTDALVVLTYDVGLAVPYAVGVGVCPTGVAPCPGCAH